MAEGHPRARTCARAAARTGVVLAALVCARGTAASDTPLSGGMVGLERLFGEGDDLSWRGYLAARGERVLGSWGSFYLDAGITTNCGTHSGAFFEIKPNKVRYDAEAGFTFPSGGMKLDLLFGHMSRHDIDDHWDGETEAWNSVGFRLRRGAYGPWSYSCSSGASPWQWSLSGARYAQVSSIDYEWDARLEASRRFRLGGFSAQASLGARLVSTAEERADGGDWFVDSWAELGFRPLNPEDKYVFYLRWYEQHDADHADGLTAGTVGLGVKFFW